MLGIFSPVFSEIFTYFLLMKLQWGEHVPIRISSLCSPWNLERSWDGFRFADISFCRLPRRECIPVARAFPFHPIGIWRRATRISGVRDRFGRRRGGSLALKVYSSNLYPSGLSDSLRRRRDHRSLSRWLQLRDNGLVESPCCSLTDLSTFCGARAVSDVYGVLSEKCENIHGSRKY